MPRPLEKLAEKAEDVDTFLRTALPSSCFCAVRLLSIRNFEACLYARLSLHGGRAGAENGVAFVCVMDAETS